MSANILKGLLRDGIQQFSQLKGENLEVYARTWAALAEKMLNNPEHNHSPEVQALIEAARKAEDYMVSIYNSEFDRRCIKEALSQALAPFTESALKKADSLIEAMQRVTGSNFDDEERKDIANALALAEGKAVQS